MKRNTRAEKARETIQIIEQGSYTVDDKVIEIKRELAASLAGTHLYRDDAFDDMWEQVAVVINSRNYKTAIQVENMTVLKAAAAMTGQGFRTGCLNFASAKNPGGGFLGGAQAQEESLALSSALYPTLMKHFDMYEYNRSRSTFLYSDQMIYSPDVLVFRDDEGTLLEEGYTMSFVTSPAVNIGAMKQNRPEELLLAKETMLRRMDKVLALFAYHNIEHLLLGAWGCGVFQNDPADVAAYFGSFLLPGGKYSRCFKSVVFAVWDRSKDGHNIQAFEQALLPVPGKP